MENSLRKHLKYSKNDLNSYFDRFCQTYSNFDNEKEMVIDLKHSRNLITQLLSQAGSKKNKFINDKIKQIEEIKENVAESKKDYSSQSLILKDLYDSNKEKEMKIVELRNSKLSCFNSINNLRRENNLRIESIMKKHQGLNSEMKMLFEEYKLLLGLVKTRILNCNENSGSNTFAGYFFNILKNDFKMFNISKNMALQERTKIIWEGLYDSVRKED